MMGFIPDHYVGISKMSSRYVRLFGGKVVAGDISVAFMQARLFSTEVVKLPENCRTVAGERVHCLLKRAMNGLRIGPLAWFRELGETLRKLGFQVTADSTVYRKVIREKGVDAIVLVLAYVDDILVFSTVASVAEKVFADLSKVFKMKRTGDFGAQDKVSDLLFGEKHLSEE